MPFFTTIIISTYSMAIWAQNRKTKDLVLIALMLAIGFFCRYEAFATAAGIGISLLIVVFFTTDEFSAFKKKTFIHKINYTIATGVLIFLPVLYSVLIWIFLNWTIMGDPLFFLTSPYSNASQTAQLGQVGIINRSIHVAVRLLPFIPIFIAITIERILTRRIFKSDYWILVAMCASITLFHLVMFLIGSSYGWLRFYAFIPVICMGWLPYEMSTLKGAIRKFSIIMFAAALIISSSIVFVYYGIQAYCPEEYEAIYMKDSNPTTVQIEVAQAINEHYSDQLILVDSTQFSLILNLDHPDNIITSSFEKYDEAIKEPWRFGISYIVVEKPAGVGAVNAINVIHPRLYDDGAPWCVERKEFSFLKIYEVIY